MKFLHQWRGVFFDGSNISRMPDKTLPSTGIRALGMLKITSSPSAPALLLGLFAENMYWPECKEYYEGKPQHK
jgi:hypothetical protein